MGFTWVYTISAGEVIKDSALYDKDISEIRTAVDWLYNNRLYCGTNLSGNCTGQNSSYYGAQDTVCGSYYAYGW